MGEKRKTTLQEEIKTPGEDTAPGVSFMQVLLQQAYDILWCF
jgi:hypothetical protein